MPKKKNKLPKRIAGVKIPKAIRKGPLADFIGSPRGRAIIAEVLMAVGGAAVVGHEARRGSSTRRALADTGDAVKTAGDKAAHAGADAAQMTGAVSDRISLAFAEAAAAFRNALQSGPDATAYEPAAAPRKKTGGATLGESPTLAH